jgi:simple sugar transport system ATP-binding protein
MSLSANILLSARTSQGMERGGFLNLAAARAFADKVVAAFDVRTSGPDRHAQTLSGGNLQKFIVGREIMQEPAALVISQPTWGVDAAAAADIHRAIQKLAADGAAVLLISQDLDELMAVSTTFAVISEGRLSQPRPTEEVTVEEIGLLMGGVSAPQEAGI